MSIEAVIEAALFVAGEEVSLTALADMIEMDKATTKAIVNTLIARYSEKTEGHENNRDRRRLSNVHVSLML